MLGALRLSGLVAASTGVFMAAEHWYAKDSWKRSHPLIDEALKLVIENHTIQVALGAPLEKTSQVNGMLEPNKPWANLALEVKGSKGSSKVTLMADGKPLSEVNGNDDLIKIEYERKFSIFDKLCGLLTQSYPQDDQYAWKIISMHVKLNDVTTVPIYVQGRHLETPKIEEMQTTPALASEDDKPTQEEVKQLDNSELLMNRKRDQMQKVSTRWKQVFIFALGGGLVFLAGRHFLRIHPIGRTTFAKQALEELRNSPILKEEIGNTVQLLDGVQGYMNYNETQGAAKVGVYGPKGIGRLVLSGHIDSVSKKWVYTQAELIKGSRRESLL
mmetsp:Transcript_8969/g.17310  ORF Transcript_8969/g.17310 Transcript_8969/m.17310 type:complete len:329 (-) Transcript_8969:1225-2211(-)